MGRDMALFADDDGVAYPIFSPEETRPLPIAKLSDDWLGHAGEFGRVMPGGRNEAPAVFRHDGDDLMITSGLMA